MSKLSIMIKEAKIINSEYNKPEKRFDDKTKEFKCVNFDICPTISKKNVKGEWETKLLSIRCTIWNENLAEKFLSAFDCSSKNYITVLDGTLTNFHTDQIQKTSNNGNDYNVNVYSYLSINVNDFIMTSKPFGEDAEKSKSEQDIKESYQDNELKIDEEIPF